MKKYGSKSSIENGGHRRGFSLIEVLVLVAVIGIVGAAAGRALQNIARTPVSSDQNFQVETQLISKMEAIRAMGFDSIAVGSPNGTLTDSVTIGGTSYTRTVTVALADVNGDGAAEANVKVITVTCGAQTVTTLISK
jgi:prepilin-type N-terminal cleavage/methylation domain-containing protein